MRFARRSKLALEMRRMGPGRVALATLALISCSRPLVTSTSTTTDAAAPSASAAIVAAPQQAPALSLFYTSDLRGRALPDASGEHLGGLARLATLVDRARLEARGVVVVDAGDFLPLQGEEGTAEEVERSAKLVAASYKRIGVAVVTPGERELSLGVERLRALLRSANVRAVAANVTAKKGEVPFDDDPLVVAGGITIGVFGVVEPPEESAASLARVGISMTDALEAARERTKSLRERGAALVVGLFHVAGGASRARQIAEQAGGVDVVVLGHGSNDIAPSAFGAGSRPRIAYAGPFGSRVGRIDVRPSDAGASELDEHSLTLTAAVPDHPGVALLPRIDGERARIAEEKAAAAERRKKGQKEPEVYETWTYASNAACGMCHEAALAQWKTTDHADAIATLKKSSHDHDPACIGCHTTGYLQRGGTRNVETAIDQFANVGCETCHGPSAAHVRSVDKKRGTSRKVDPVICLGCHTPDQNLGTFDVTAALASIVGPGHGAAKPSPR
jgi:2',3'-cyclic-nucleotide 2'-phosphodiesterase (5'-nucleotidase family)